MGKRTLLSLCDYSGAWSAPYQAAGYAVIRVDLAHPPGLTRAADGAWLIGGDVCEYTPGVKPWAVIAAPPCTCFCRPGARWWTKMDATGQTARDIAVFRACLRLCHMAQAWWALENPPGRHIRLIPELGTPAWQYTPCEYGDPWHKQTYIWGTALKPTPQKRVPVPPTIRSPSGHTSGRIARMSSTWKREREKTPPGFAAAFFRWNPL